MKIKIITLILSLLMLLSTSIYAEDTTQETQQSESMHEMVQQESAPKNLQFQTLIALGILEDKEADQLVTRGEMCAVALRLYMAGVEPPVYQGAAFFTDVPLDYLYASEIYLAYQLGLVTGYDEHYFGVIENVKAEQAIAMMVNALGYGVRAIEYGGYPTGYSKAAIQLKLYYPDSPLNYNELAMLVYSALDVDKAESIVSGDYAQCYPISGKTILSDMDIIKGKGQITAAGSLSISGNAIVNSDEIAIDRVVYKKNQIELREDDVGKMIEFYFRAEDTDGENILIYFSELTDRFQIYEIDNILDVTVDSIRFIDKDGEDQKIYLSSNTDIIYNNVYLSQLGQLDKGINQLIGKNSFVKAISSNGSDECDTLVISNFTTVLTTGVSKTSDVIYLHQNTPYLDKNSIDLSDLEPEIDYSVIIDGIPQTVADIQAFDVLDISTGNDNGYMTIYVTRDAVSGQIQSISTDQIIIDETEATISQNYLVFDKDSEDAVIEEGNKVGQTGDFYFDIQGKLAFSRISLSNRQFGYVNAYEEQQNIDRSLRIEIFSENDGWGIYEFAEKVEIDMKECRSKEEILNLLSTGITPDKRLVKFSANSNNEITYLDTAGNSLPFEGEMNLVAQDVSSIIDYYKGYNLVGTPYKIYDTTKLLLIPSDLSKKEQYRFTNNSYFAEKETYQFDLYNPSSVLVTECAVVKNADASGEFEDNLSIITKKTTYADEEGNLYDRLYVVRASGNNIVNATINVDRAQPLSSLITPVLGYENITELLPGDAIRCKYDSNGTATKIKFYFRASEPPQMVNTIINPMESDEFGYVTVASKDDIRGFMKVVANPDIEDPSAAKDTDCRSYLLRAVALYDIEAQKAFQSSINEIGIGDKVFFWGNIGHPTLTLIVRN